MGAVVNFLSDDDAIPSGTTKQVTGVMQDANGNAVPAASISAATLSINDTNTGAFINSVNQANILNDGVRGSIDNAGNFTLTLLPADTTMTATTPTQGITLTIRWTYTGGKKGEKRINLKLVSAPDGA